ncbi:MAG: polynucleotide adenylyltransferase [Verrucomicrobia bacterium GWF2_51_19]|nr:MAG: polynucleotide adenylyltransferase [Verrucomicrobia bacterium GWF2_51_19]HCJ11761.1 polynucleotide adenylyltransferase [Opitutae bacterium]
MQLTLPPEIALLCEKIASRVAEVGGRAFVVGGCVRDSVLGLPAKEADMEVFGLSQEALEACLGAFRVEYVGKSFGVYKLKDAPIDIALPRQEVKVGEGHCNFDVTVDPHLSLREAASRRDFTINAMLFDPLTRELIDPFGGLPDLKKRCLRHVSEKFSEDPLRVLRGMQFVARFDLAVAAETLELCRQLSPHKLSKERLWGEWKKLFLDGKTPSRGLQFLRDTGWLAYFPELEALIGCAQDPQWHPEGDVWIHTLMSVDTFANKRIGDPQEDIIVGFAVLCHDFGKPATTFVDEKGRIRSPNHEAVGEGPTRAFLSRLTNEMALIDAVVVLVTHHLQPVSFFKDNASRNAVRRLIYKVKNIDRLLRVTESDQTGLPRPTQAVNDWFQEHIRALNLENAIPKPILLGRHLLQLGMRPSPRFKPILDAAFQAQLDGIFETEADGIAFLKGLVAEESMAVQKKLNP